MHENKLVFNASEPTCDGWWLCEETLSSDGAKRRRVYHIREIGGQWHAAKHSLGPWNPIHSGDKWTGPIPVPEDKPAPVRAHCPGAVERENELARKFCEAMDKPAYSIPSEDENLGRLLWHYYRSRSKALLPFNLQDANNQRHIVDTALRFRDECVKPHARFVAAACALRALYAEGTINLDDQEGWEKEFDTAYDALSVPAPSAPDELPKPEEGVREPWPCIECGRDVRDVGVWMGLGSGKRICQDCRLKEKPKPGSPTMFKCMRCGSTQPVDGRFGTEGRDLCFDCRRAQEHAEKKPRLTDKELGRTAANWLRDELRIKAVGFLPSVELRALGIAIRAGLQGEAPSSPVSNDVLEGIAIDHLVLHRKIDESLAETCAMMILDIRAKLEGKP